MYSLISVDNEEKIRAKGVNKTLKHSEFVDVLFNKKVIRHNMKRIQINYIDLVLTMFLKFHYLVLIIKGMYEMAVLILVHIFIKILIVVDDY